MVDAVQRESALNALVGLCGLPLEHFASRDRLHFFIHLAGVHSALYTLQTAEIQLRDLALDYILQLARILAEGLAAEKAHKANKSTVYQQLTRKLIISALWPGKFDWSFLSHSNYPSPPSLKMAQSVLERAWIYSTKTDRKKVSVVLDLRADWVMRFGPLICYQHSTSKQVPSTSVVDRWGLVWSVLLKVA